MNSKIFISYARKDYDAVVRLRDEIFRRTGVRPWMDLSGIETGTQFAEVIAKAIDDCELLVFVISRHSLKSEWTEREVLYAQAAGKKIYPVVIDDVELTGKLKFLLINLDRVDIRNDVEREKVFSDMVSFCGLCGSGESASVGGSGDVMLAKRSKWSPVNRMFSAGKPKTSGLVAVVACAILFFGCILGGGVWCAKCMRNTNAEKQHIVPYDDRQSAGRSVACKSDEPDGISVADAGSAISSESGLIIKNGKLLSGKSAEEAKQHLEQTARTWENASKICAELLRETIALRRKINPFVQTGALDANDSVWVSACKRADEYLNWVAEHGKTPDAQIKERTAIRNGFRDLLERLEVELKRRLEVENDESMAGGTFVKRTISRAALELAFLPEDDRAAAIVDFYRSVRMTSRELYAKEKNLDHNEVVDRIGREYDVAAAEGSKLFKAGMHRTDEIARSRPDLVMQFYDIRHRVLSDINVLVCHGQTEKALLYYLSAKKSFEVLHLDALKRPDFTSAKSVE